MFRTQISLSDHERTLLDAETHRTGRSMAALIRDAVNLAYGSQAVHEEEIDALRAVAGAWADRDEDGAQWVERLRSGDRLRNTP